MASFPKIRILSGMHGRNAVVFIDGLLIEGVTDIEVEVHNNDVVRVRLELIAGEFELDNGAEEEGLP